MTRTFVHQFDPKNESPCTGADVELTVQQIEAAGYQEMLQSSGARLSWLEVWADLLCKRAGAFSWLGAAPCGILCRLRYPLALPQAACRRISLR